MKKINTVLGPISPEDLGLTLVHEHISVGFPGWECDPLSRPYDRETMARRSLKSLEQVKAYGVQSIIDATPADLNRDVDLLKEVSEKLRINIICATGRYTEDMGKWAYLKQRMKSRIGDMQTELYEGFMQDITQGIGPSAVKPGVIKVATGLNTISPLEEALLRAAARAAKETGLPIITGSCCPRISWGVPPDGEDGCRRKLRTRWPTGPLSLSSALFYRLSKRQESPTNRSGS